MTKKSDTEFYKQAMKYVKPLRHKKKAEISRAKRPNSKKLEVDKKVASDDWFIDIEITCDANEPLFFAHPGIQLRTLKKLKQGKLSIQARLDLHGVKLSTAYDKLHQFLDACQAQELRTVLIIHGKGTAKLKSAIDKWLKEHPSTLAFSSAIPADGGTGALYLLLRNPRKKYR